MTLAVAACKPGAAVLKLTGTTMGTTYTIVAQDPEGSVNETDLKQAVIASLAKTNAQMSNWDVTSEVARFNAARTTDPVPVSDELAQVVAAAQQINAASDGQFDLTLGPAIETWGFGATRGDSHIPDQAKLAASLIPAGQAERLHLSGGNLRKSHPETGIYLSSIGKGFGVDQIAATLRSFGLNDFMVEIGGDLYASGTNGNGQPWQIGIESPDALHKTAFRIASLSDMGMATSGDYRNYFEQDGKRYSHILDARTGRPITHNTASVTVLADNAMLADGWATALMALGTKRGLDVANEQKLAVLFIDRTQSGFATTSSDRFAQLNATG